MPKTSESIFLRFLHAVFCKSLESYQKFDFYYSYGIDPQLAYVAHAPNICFWPFQK